MGWFISSLPKLAWD
uniref:Uncharacterized protein n=1 Tax=Arundo donax TaxID=35708 RepID=A0A0A8YPR7_ARUDO